MPNAAEVVKAYQEKKREQNAGDRQRELIENATRDVLAEFGGSFTSKDVRACVAEMLSDVPELEGWSANRRSRIVSKTLAAETQSGALVLDANENYQQRGGRQAPTA